MKNFEITCPCCKATIVVDRLSGRAEALAVAARTRGKGAGSRTTENLLRVSVGLEHREDIAEERIGHLLLCHPEQWTARCAAPEG
jgi:hypothetical protein